jgi:hypothetical protein
MTPPTEYIDKLKHISLAAWFAALLLFIILFRYIRQAIVFVLMKLYELFIGSKGHISVD